MNRPCEFVSGVMHLVRVNIELKFAPVLFRIEIVLNSKFDLKLDLKFDFILCFNLIRSSSDSKRYQGIRLSIVIESLE